MRLVLNLEKMVIKESQRNFTYLALYDHSADAVIVNRVIPDSVTDPFLETWRRLQAEHLKTVHEIFAPIPILEVPLFPAEVLGLPMLEKMAEDLFGDRDPTEFMHRGRAFHIDQTDDGCDVVIPAHQIEKADIDLIRTGDELVVRMGSMKRHIVLPRSMMRFQHTTARLEAHGAISDQEIVDALCTVMRQDAFNHRDVQAIDGRHANGMSVMYMGAHTGCNTVYGSTPPSNPHPYPWMNSLFQDGATISWLISESAIINHARRSVAPERLADALLSRESDVAGEAEYFTLTRLDDTLMTDQEVRELPKVWAIGGDGAMGDIGFQNVSKVILQNKPNMMLLMLDTQVYSNTGGQNSDSSNMLGGYDMNQFGVASQGKLIEKKSVAEAQSKLVGGEPDEADKGATRKKLAPSTGRKKGSRKVGN